jgi:hypothetical protein
MSRALYNATVIPEIIKLISKEKNITEQESFDLFYRSKTLKLLNDEETGLYGQSALFIFSIFMQET